MGKTYVLQPDLDATLAQIRAEIKAVEADIEKREYLTSGDARKLEDRLLDDIKKAEQRLHAGMMKSLGAAEHNLNEQLQNARGLLNDLRADVDQLSSGTGVPVGETSRQSRTRHLTVEQRLTALKDDMLERISTFEEEIHAELDKRAQTLSRQLVAKSQFAEMADELAASTRQRIQDHKELQALLQENQQHGASQSAEVGAKLAGLENKATQAETEAKSLLKGIEGVAKDLASRAGSIRNDLDRTVQDTATLLQKFKEEIASEQTLLHEKVLNDLSSLKELDLKPLQQMCLECEGMYSHTFTWTIIKAPLELKHPTGDTPIASYFSPKFEAAGVSGLRLELRLFNQRMLAEVQQKRGLEGDPANNCTIVLHGAPGLAAIVRLSVGKVSQMMEATFDAENLTMETRSMCVWQEQLNRQELSLDVSIEILDSSSTQRGVIEGKPKPRPKTPQELLLSSMDLTTSDAPAATEKENTPPCVYAVKRSIKHNTLEQVKAQVEQLRAIMVRRIEWRIEQPAHLQRYYSRGTPVQSSEFSAGGLLGLQFVFYPSGCDGATVGQCSFFLKAAAGVNLKGWLQVGAERKEVQCALEQDGLIGRTNFCSTFAWSGGEYVVLALEIDECFQDQHIVSKHVQRVNLPNDDVVEQLLHPIESVVKLTRTTGCFPPSLNSVKLLPPLCPSKTWPDTSSKADARRNVTKVSLKPLHRSPRKGFSTSASGTRSLGHIDMAVALQQTI